MTRLGHKVARRTLIKGAGLGLAAGVAGGMSAAQAASTERALDASQGNLAAPLYAVRTANMAYNGSVLWSQRNLTTAISTVGRYKIQGPDFWVAEVSGPVATIEQFSGTPFPTQPWIMKAVKFKITTAKAPLDTGDFIHVCTPIVGPEASRLNFGSSNAVSQSICFMIRSTINQRMYVLRGNAAGNRSHITAVDVVANSDTFVALANLPGDQAGTWSTAVGTVGQWIAFQFGCGSVYQGPANTWVDKNIVAASDVTNFGATPDNTIMISALFTVYGPELPSLANLQNAMRSDEEDGRLVKGYYQKNVNRGTARLYNFTHGTDPQTVHFTHRDGNANTTVVLPQPMLTPDYTLNLWDAAGAVGKVSYFDGASGGGATWHNGLAPALTYASENHIGFVAMGTNASATQFCYECEGGL